MAQFFLSHKLCSTLDDDDDDNDAGRQTSKSTRFFCSECGSVTSCQCSELEPSWYYVRAL